MENLDTREWLLTNGLGSFANGTVCDAHTRTYHGWLVAALDPPGQRTLLLARIDAAIEVAGQGFDLGINFWQSGAIAPEGYRLLRSFQTEPVPTWIWGQTTWQLSRQLLMPHGLLKAESGEQPRFDHRVLVQYRYEGNSPTMLYLKPLVADRIFHYQQRAEADLRFTQQVGPKSIVVRAERSTWVGTAWQLEWTAGDYVTDGMWYWDYRYPEETQRGLADREDLFSPGYLKVALEPGETITLQAYVLNSDLPEQRSFTAQTFDQLLAAEQVRLAQTIAPETMIAAGEVERQLLKAGDQFIVYRSSTQGPTLIAGYPWFNDWGRDTLIALPGLTLTTQRWDLAKGLLRTFGQHCQQGLIPNAFPDAGAQPFYNSLDAALWWIETLGLYLEASQDWDFLAEQYPVVWGIYKSLMVGTLYRIRVDAFDGLVTWDAPQLALTWMDATVTEEPVTPRRGKPVEINALWYSALCWAQQWAERLHQNPETDRAVLGNQMRRFAAQREQVAASLQKYWNSADSYLYDTILPNDDMDPTIRPNAVIALSLAHCGFPPAIAQPVLQLACDRLLTPYGLRTLDPADPQYIGRYQGGIWQRDRAYHQGTVWPWLLGPFVRAWQRFHPTKPLPFDWQPLLNHFQKQACLGSISEMFDGNEPHLPRGATAQAWSVAEVIRHWIGDRPIS